MRQPRAPYRPPSPVVSLLARSGPLPADLPRRDGSHRNGRAAPARRYARRRRSAGRGPVRRPDPPPSPPRGPGAARRSRPPRAGLPWSPLLPIYQVPAAVSRGSQGIQDQARGRSGRARSARVKVGPPNPSPTLPIQAARETPQARCAKLKQAPIPSKAGPTGPGFAGRFEAQSCETKLEQSRSSASRDAASSNRVDYVSLAVRLICPRPSRA